MAARLFRKSAQRCGKACRTQLGFSIDADPTVIDSQADLAQHTIIAAPQLSLDDIPAHLHYVPTEDGSAVLAWELIVRPPSGDNWFDLSVPATSEGNEQWGNLVRSTTGSSTIPIT